MKSKRSLTLTRVELDGAGPHILDYARGELLAAGFPLHANGTYNQNEVDVTFSIDGAALTFMWEESEDE